MDATLELCDICGDAAAGALSRLTDCEVASDKPLLHRREELDRLDTERSFAELLDIFGPLGGAIAVILPERDAQLLVELLLGEETPVAFPLSELAASTLQEVANIMVSACLNTLGPRLKSTLLPSVPRMLVGSGKDLVAEAMLAVPGATVAIETRFSISAPLCHGSLFIIPAPSMLEAVRAGHE